MLLVIDASILIADIWFIDKSTCNVNRICSKVFSNDEELLQPAFRFLDTPAVFCGRCKWLFDPSLIQPAVAAIPGVDRLPLMSFICESAKVIDFAFPDSANILETEKKNLIAASSSMIQDAEINISTPLLLYLKRELLNASLEQQRGIPNFSSLTARDLETFRRRVESGAQTVSVYEVQISSI